MSTRKITISMLFAGAALAAVAMPLPGFAAVGVYLNVAPPPPMVEMVPPPRYGYVWVPGFWEWRHNRHVWMQGRWVRERPGYIYQPDVWVQRDGRWYHERGRWNRGGRGDRDHDGVPNRYDRRPNDPYRR